jgi:ABC-type uncharacterized transport system permease subunit
VVAAFVGFSIEGLPAIIHVPLALLVGGLAGALYGFIPGALKAYTGAHEVIVTIMLNYVAINITDYLADGPWKDPSPTNIVARTPAIFPSAELPVIGNIPTGFILALVAAFVVWWLLYRTTLGLRSAHRRPELQRGAVCRHPRGPHHHPDDDDRRLLAGLGGAVETQGINGRFQPGFNTGLGFDGITVALLGKTSPFGVIPAALLLGAMRAGSSQMQFERRCGRRDHRRHHRLHPLLRRRRRHRQDAHSPARYRR